MPSLSPSPSEISSDAIIAYFVHDLADPAVSRRVRMFRRGGAEVRLFGFRRTETPISEVAGIPAVDLGRTQDGRLLARAVKVGIASISPDKQCSAITGSHVIVARNLEMLSIAQAARKRYAPEAPLVYELLDIHALMVKDRTPSKLLRDLEHKLLTETDSIIISSPAFEKHYLDVRQPGHPSTLLLENKVFLPDATDVVLDGMAETAKTPRPDGPPWRICWSGILRCQRSLDCLSALTRKHPNLVEVDIWGRWAVNMTNVDDILSSSPGLRYHGPYRNPDDLACIYGPAHFTWAIDFYEAGFNSTWLLPNRLYEGALWGTVPIALASVETGRWLAREKSGVLIGDEIEPAIEGMMLSMNQERYQSAIQTMGNIDRSRLLCDATQCRALVRTLTTKRAKAAA